MNSESDMNSKANTNSNRTLQFLDFYMPNRELLWKEIDRDSRSIRQLRSRIEALTADVQQKFQQLFMDTMRKRGQPQSQDDVAARNSQIKRIYLLIKQINKYETEKRAFATEACDSLDKHLEALNEHIESATIQSANADKNDAVLMETFSSIKRILDKPVTGSAVVIDMIKKIEAAESKNDEKSMAVDHVNKNVAEGSSDTAENFEALRTAQLTKETAAEVSDLIHRMDNLEYFTDKVDGICTAMRNKYENEAIFNFVVAVPVINNEQDVVEEASTTGSEVLLCHCRLPEYGEMVYCDGANCKTRWYHFECVGVTKTPVGMWFCPSCIIFENADTSDSLSSKV